MTRRRGQRKAKLAKQPGKSFPAQHGELNPLSLLGETSDTKHIPLPPQPAALPGLAEWYLPYKHQEMPVLNMFNESLVLKHGADAQFQDSAVSMCGLWYLMCASQSP
jgi:hypothetical protein